MTVRRLVGFPHWSQFGISRGKTDFDGSSPGDMGFTTRMFSAPDPDDIRSARISHERELRCITERYSVVFLSDSVKRRNYCSGRDLPLNFHPATIRASAVGT